MVTMNNIKKQLNENINDKSKDELYSLSESLVDEFFKAYVKDDLEAMKDIYATIDEFKANLDGKYGNVDAVFTGLELQKQKEYYVLQQYQYSLLYREEKVKTSYMIVNELKTKLSYLKQILVYYFLNTAADNECVKDLDKLIANIRDDIVDLSAVGNMYFKDSTPVDVNLDIETSKEIIHDVYTDDVLKFLKENGMVEIQMRMIEIYELQHQLNKEYKELNLEIDELFSKNNGFSDISESFIEMLKNENGGNIDGEKLMQVLPEYDIATATFISTDPPVTEN